MLTDKARTQLQREWVQAYKHLEFLRRCAQAQGPGTPTILLATPDMISVAQATVERLERQLAEGQPTQLSLFA